MLVFCLVSLPMFANAEPDANRAIAKSATERGTTRYNAGDFEGALHEFEEAYRFVAAPELEYNIARCLERLGRSAEAATAYERYVAARPYEARTAEIAAHAAQLRAGAVPHSRRRSTPVAPIALAALTGVAVVTGATLLGVVGTDVNGAMDHSLSSQRIDTLKHEADAGYAMLGVAGIAAVVDVALWVRWVRQPHGEVAR